MGATPTFPDMLIYSDPILSYSKEKRKKCKHDRERGGKKTGCLLLAPHQVHPMWGKERGPPPPLTHPATIGNFPYLKNDHEWEENYQWLLLIGGALSMFNCRGGRDYFCTTVNSRFPPKAVGTLKWSQVISPGE